MTTPNDINEPSPASAGSHGEPVAWLVRCGDEWQMVSLFREHADAAAAENDAEVVPLFRQPTLTDDERDAIEVAVAALRPRPTIYQMIVQTVCANAGEHARKLRGLLERSQ